MTTTAPHRFDDGVCGVKDRIELDGLGDAHAFRASITHPQAMLGRTEHDPEYGTDQAGAVYLMGYYTANAVCWLADRGACQSVKSTRERQLPTFSPS